MPLNERAPKHNRNTKNNNNDIIANVPNDNQTNCKITNKTTNSDILYHMDGDTNTRTHINPDMIYR